MAGRKSDFTLTHQYQETAADSIDDPIVFFNSVEG